MSAIEKTPTEKVQSFIGNLISEYTLKDSDLANKEFPDVLQVSPTMAIMNTGSDIMVKFCGLPITKAKYTFTPVPDIDLDYQMRVYIKKAIKYAIETIFSMSCAYELPPDHVYADIVSFEDNKEISVSIGLAKASIKEFSEVMNEDVGIAYADGIDTTDIQTNGDLITYMLNVAKLAFYWHDIVYIPVLKKGRDYHILCRINNQDQHYKLSFDVSYND